MVDTFLRTQESLVQPVIFGKLPNRADFVRVNATHPVLNELDDIIQRSMESLGAQEGWQERYDTAVMVDIVYTSRDRKWLFLGALRTSQDQSGRRYPLLGGVAFPSQTLAGERRLLPIACEVFFDGLREQLANAVENSVEGMACRQFLETQAKHWTNAASDMPLAEEIVRRFMGSNHPSILEPPLAASNPGASVAQALLNIVFYRDFLRRFDSPSAIQVSEIPLCRARGEAALHACAWLTLLLSLYGGEEPRMGSFLLQMERRTAFALLHFTFGHLPERALLATMGDEGTEDARLNLWSEKKAWQAHKRYAETAYAMDRLLNDPNTPWRCFSRVWVKN